MTLPKKSNSEPAFPGTFEGTGGMATKVRAAKKVSEYGVATLILNGQEAGLLPEVSAGGPGGSLFLAKERRFTSRKHWIAFTLRPRGTLTARPRSRRGIGPTGQELVGLRHSGRQRPCSIREMRSVASTRMAKSSPKDS